jgi:hypothetical protein
MYKIRYQQKWNKKEKEKKGGKEKEEDSDKLWLFEKKKNWSDRMTEDSDQFVYSLFQI